MGRSGGGASVLLVAALLAALLGVDTAAQADPAAREDLAAAYRERQATLDRGPFAVPMQVEASVSEDRVAGNVYAVLDHPFSHLARELAKPSVWCEILTLHFNVKSCLVQVSADDPAVTDLLIATARKYYVPPSSRNTLSYRLDLSRSDAEVVKGSLGAERGPLGVRDMQIEVGAIGLPDGRSFVRLHYGYTEGWATRIATRAYLATFGRRKIGFSVTGRTATGDPIYVRGAAGALERNALRYHLAIEAWFDTLAKHEGDRFEARVARWYDLTDRHSEQLYEMSRETYRDMKRRERDDMLGQAATRRAKRRR